MGQHHPRAAAAGVVEGLRDGTVDCIATDHAPHAPEAKELPFDQAPPGMLGLETALALGEALRTALAETGSDVSVLVKGSRVNRLERVVAALTGGASTETH